MRCAARGIAVPCGLGGTDPLRPGACPSGLAKCGWAPRRRPPGGSDAPRRALATVGRHSRSRTPPALPGTAHRDARSARRLLDTAELPHVTLQITPLASTPHPGGAGGFTLASFPGPMPEVVTLENLIGATYVEGVDEVRVFSDAFERIVAAALPVDDTQALIGQLEDRSRA